MENFLKYHYNNHQKNQVIILYNNFDLVMNFHSNPMVRLKNINHSLHDIYYGHNFLIVIINLIHYDLKSI